MLGALTAVIETPEFQDAGFAYAVSVRHVGHDTIVDLRVDEGDGPPVDANWRVLCSDQWRFWIGTDCHDIFVHEPDEPLARQFTDDQSMLFFNTAPARPEAVVAQLFAVHVEAGGGKIPFQQYLSTGLPLQTLIAGGFGQLAHGPAFLINAYQDVLNRNAMGPSVVSNGPLRMWSGGQLRLATPALRLACLGGAMVLANAFMSERIDQTPAADR